MITIKRPEYLHIQDSSGAIFYGGNQIWYPRFWQRQAGCGPTACSALMRYLAETREGCRGLAAEDSNTRHGFTQLMRSVWNYVTPTLQGVNRTEILSDGAAKYGRDRGVQLAAEVFPVADQKAMRPSYEQIADFLEQTAEQDRPAAFLNLSNGSVRNLDNWHWVTLIGIDRGRGMALMYDQGGRSEIDIQLWLESAVRGGGFVTLDKKM